MIERMNAWFGYYNVDDYTLVHRDGKLALCKLVCVSTTKGEFDNRELKRMERISQRVARMKNEWWSVEVKGAKQHGFYVYQFLPELLCNLKHAIILMERVTR